MLTAIAYKIGSIIGFLLAKLVMILIAFAVIGICLAAIKLIGFMLEDGYKNNYRNNRRN
jgi:mannose/fructose/N-acetylgalactosamine-specific phosphotransferase system component IIC